MKFQIFAVFKLSRFLKYFFFNYVNQFLKFLYNQMTSTAITFVVKHV